MKKILMVILIFMLLSINCLSDNRNLSSSSSDTTQTDDSSDNPSSSSKCILGTSIIGNCEVE